MIDTVCTENQEGRERVWESSWLNGDLRIARDFKNRIGNNYVPKLDKDVLSQKQLSSLVANSNRSGFKI